VEILRNPSRAKKFFQRLSRTPPPIKVDKLARLRGSSHVDGSGQQMTSLHVENPEQRQRHLVVEDEHVPPDLDSLERQIERLARDLDKISSHHGCIKGENSSEGHFQSHSPTMRPDVSLDRISFFACMFALNSVLIYRLVGL
jgi:hypothetical protein